MPEKEFVADFFGQVMDEYDEPDPDEEFSDAQTLRHARIPASKAKEFRDRVVEMAEEFADEDSVPGERVYGFLAQVYLTNLPELPDEE